MVSLAESGVLSSFHGLIEWILPQSFRNLIRLAVDCQTAHRVANASTDSPDLREAQASEGANVRLIRFKDCQS